MDLESLKKRNAANVTSVQVADLSLHLRKLTAANGMAVGKAFQAAGHTDPNGAEPSPEQYVVAYALLLSKTICDEAGALTLDSDEGRAELAKLDFQTSQQLALKAQEWSGLAADESKKN